MSSGFSCYPTTFGSSGTQSVIVSYGGKTASFKVTAKAVEVSSISIESNPDQTSYFVGDELNTSGLRLNVSYNNGATEVVSSGFSCYPTTFGSSGTQSVIVSYEGREALFSVTVVVGKYVTFGRYPQTTEGTDSTPIEWLVLARDGQKVLLISRYGLEAKPYNESYGEITWESCTLRKWLNSTFIDIAFSEEEQNRIILTEIDNSYNQGFSQWRTYGGNKTNDKVFLLSCAEANMYLGVTKKTNEDGKAQIAPTAYAKEAGAFTTSRFKTEEDVDAGWWWLRSPGLYQSDAVYVSYDGSIYSIGINSRSGCVRPALWINLQSDID